MDRYRRANRSNNSQNTPNPNPNQSPMNSGNNNNPIPPPQQQQQKQGDVGVEGKPGGGGETTPEKTIKSKPKKIQINPVDEPRATTSIFEEPGM